MTEKDLNDTLDRITLADTDRQRIIRACRQNHHVKNKVFLYSRQLAAAVAVAILSATSLTAYAAVNAYQAYMEKMSAEQIQELYKNVQSGTHDADRFSRPLLATERERLANLRVTYEDGLRFPEEELCRFDGTDTAIPEDGLSYDYKNMIFYLPERELTDEELLQIIDVWEKSNYSLGLFNEAALGGTSGTEMEPFSPAAGQTNATEEEQIAAVKEEMAKHMQNVSSTKEELLRQNAATILQSLADADTSDMEWEISLYGEDNPRYIAAVKEGDRYLYRITYTEDSTPETLCVYHYVAHNTPYENTAETYSEEQIRKRLSALEADAKESLVLFGVSDRVIRSEYGYNREALSGEGVRFAILSLTTDSGNRYCFTYDLVNGVCHEMLTYDARYQDVDYLSLRDFHGDLSESRP